MYKAVNIPNTILKGYMVKKVKRLENCNIRYEGKKSIILNQAFKIQQRCNILNGNSLAIPRFPSQNILKFSIQFSET